MMSNYKPTSKSSLKLYCITMSKGDVRQASELYDFMIKDMEELPIFDPVPPTWTDNAKTTVTGLFDFVKNNKEGIGQVVDMVRAVIGKRAAVSDVVKEALPEIN